MLTKSAVTWGLTCWSQSYPSLWDAHLDLFWCDIEFLGYFLPHRHDALIGVALQWKGSGTYITCTCLHCKQHLPSRNGKWKMDHTIQREIFASTKFCGNVSRPSRRNFRGFYFRETKASCSDHTPTVDGQAPHANQRNDTERWSEEASLCNNGLVFLLYGDLPN